MSLIKQFNEEFGYLCYKYFGHIKVEPYHTYNNILMYINDLPYEYIRFNSGIEVIMPDYDDLLDGDFDDIYILQANEPFNFSFRVINKKDGIVRTKDYNYKNNRGNVFTSYAYNEIDDSNNEFKRLYEESGLKLERFVIQNYFEKAENSNEIICSSVINDDKLSYFITSFTNLNDCIDEIMEANDDGKYQAIKRNKQILMEMNEQLAIDKIKRIKKVK